MTHEELVIEIRELSKDLLGFKQARDILYGRLRDLEEMPERQAMLEDWPAFKVIDNGLIMAIVRCEGLLGNYHEMLEDMVMPDNVVPLEKNHD